ncbi:hypothetical protein [Streptomonospora wellingtoniae]|uniref:DivIVA domain-containing protein n=1 Tax=Streptomonospora wellingtoniae TaxID=3075544 RepID=A0ABU2KZF0_9ACTN|nr:hypothetical protein [Streptomonospora sp. DSM 45055]MDT0304453.1 hypothetical protein [Streptomonospora sp. DSM 45055]
MTDSSPESRPTAPSNPAEAADLPLEFDVVRRGYDRRQVLTLLETLQRSLDDPAAPGAVTPREARDRAAFDMVLRGFDRAQVDAAFERLLESLAAVRGEDGGGAAAGEVRAERADPVAFDRVLRGYDPLAAAELVDAGAKALRGLRGGESGAAAARAAADALRDRRDALPRALRGFDRRQVDRAVDAVCEELERGPQPR